ncbi:MAG: DUF4097 family beta strand repeat-containing protein [bacterium]|nr:DUF4097 family beta strand repeat-containing protein [bacterium]
MEEYKKYPVKKDSLSISIALASYDLSIEGCEGNEVIIETDDKETADKRLTISMEGKELRITENSGISFGRYEGELVLRLPLKKQYSGGCKVASGDVEIKNVFYNGIIKSASGDIAIESLKGDIEIGTTSGDIELNDIEGNANVHSMSGDIEINDGTIHSLDIATTSGDISFCGKLLLEKDCFIKSVSGDIELDISNAENLLIESKTLSGDIEIEGDYSVSKEDKNGYKHLSLITVSGDINVELGDDCKNVYATTVKARDSFHRAGHGIFDRMIHNGVHRTIDEAVKRAPRGVEIVENEEPSRTEHISRILKMLEDGKVNAEQARELIDAL